MIPSVPFSIEKFCLRAGTVFYYSNSMTVYFSFKADKQNKSKKCSCVFACNLAERN